MYNLHKLFIFYGAATVRPYCAADPVHPIWISGIEYDDDENNILFENQVLYDKKMDDHF